MIPLYKPYMPDDLPELNDILYSGALAYGKWGRLFEESIRRYVGAPYVVSVNSFSSAIQIVMMTLGVGPEDEIIASPQCCLASNMPILSVGAKVVWADIDPLTGTLDPNSVRKKISSATKAIMHNHHCGYPGYIDEINEIGKEKGIPVIDDCIESFGAKYKGQRMGGLNTDITVFSFQTVRLPNTIDGGAICFNNREWYEKAYRLRDLGVDRSTFRDVDGEISSQSDVPYPGLGVTMSEVSSYIGYRQMVHIDELLADQRRNAGEWLLNLSNNDLFQPLGRTEIEPNYWVFGLRTKAGKAKGIEYFRSLGFYASGVHLPNYYYSAFKNPGTDLLGVREFHNQFFAIPCGWWFRK